MLVIRAEQIEAFDRAAREEYHRELAGYFRATIPAALAGYSDEVLLTRIAAADRRACDWGVVTPDGLVQFIGLDLVVGERFDQLPASRRYLESAATTPDTKVHLLFDRVLDSLRSAS